MASQRVTRSQQVQTMEVTQTANPPVAADPLSGKLFLVSLLTNHQGEIGVFAGRMKTGRIRLCFGRMPNQMYSHFMFDSLVEVQPLEVLSRKEVMELVEHMLKLALSEQKNQYEEKLQILEMRVKDL